MLCLCHISTFLSPIFKVLQSSPTFLSTTVNTVVSGIGSEFIVDYSLNSGNDYEDKQKGRSGIQTCNLVTLSTPEECNDFDYDFDEIPELMEVEDSDVDNDDMSEEYNKEEEDVESQEKEWERIEVEDRESEHDETYDGLFNGLLVFLLDNRYTRQHPSEDSIDWNKDLLIFPSDFDGVNSDVYQVQLQVFTAYKRVAQKVHPVSGTFPEEARVRRSFPHNPLDSLPVLTPYPPEFVPTERLTNERMKELNVNKDEFLWPEEEKLFQHILKLNEATLPYEEKDRGTLRTEYFSDYIMPTVPHTPWEYKNIPIPPGIREKVIEMLKSKMDAGVYEQSQSSYRG